MSQQRTLSPKEMSVGELHPEQIGTGSFKIKIK